MRHRMDGPEGFALLVRLNQDRLLCAGGLALALLAGGWLGAVGLG